MKPTIVESYCNIRLANGGRVRVNAYPTECTEVTVFDCEGQEVGHWVVDEWEEPGEGATVMGAIMGAMNWAGSPVRTAE